MEEAPAPEVVAPVAKKVKAPKAPKAPKEPKAVKPKTPKVKGTGHNYVELIKDAIVLLKERTGSSIPAIKKAIDAKAGKTLGTGWEKRLTTSLKAMVKSGKLVKVAQF
jgi:histone H1/5